ncbi:MAG TPA: IPT/TIG domain-containing protein [Gemmatimonadaceae bacterium]
MAKFKDVTSPFRPMRYVLTVAGLVLWSCGGSGGDSTTSPSGSGSPNPAPSISSVSPSQAAAGSPAQTVTVNGSGFVQASTVTFGGTARATTFVSASQLTASLAAADLATAGTYPIAVTNPSPGGGTSAQTNFVVSGALALSSFSPATSTTGLDSLVLAINGSGFASSAVVMVNGVAVPSTFVGATQLLAVLKSNVLQTPGTLAINVSNAGGTGASASATFTVTDACTVLASALPYNPSSLGFALYRPVLDPTSVYWVDETLGSGSSIKKVSKTGGSVTVLASGLGAVNQIAVDGTNVYWTEYNEANGNGQIRSVPIGGGTITTLASGTPAGSSYDVFYPTGIALDANYVYWGEQAGGGAIRRVPKAGGQVIDIGRGQGSVNFLALDASQSNFYILGDSGSFFRLPIGGGTRQALAAKVGLNLTGPLEIDQNAIYSEDLTDASSGRGGSIFAVPTNGGAVSYLVTKENSPHNVATDQNYVYYPHAPITGDLNFHFVRKVAKGGGTPVLYPNCSAGTVAGVIGVAVDSTAVYVMGYDRNNAGIVFKQAK